MQRAFPHSDAEALATGAWALVHGLAFLHLDRKFDAQDPAVVERRVGTACLGVLTAPATERPAAHEASLPREPRDG